MASKIERIRLVRPESGGFGFYIRGGAEHGLGIYISQVEVGSEAHVKGLKKGDQILKVCGLYVEKATHKEIFSLIKEKTTLELKVRSEGVLPVKQTKASPVSWKNVKDDGAQSSDEIDEGIRLDEPQNKVEDPGGGSKLGGSSEERRGRDPSRIRGSKGENKMVGGGGGGDGSDLDYTEVKISLELKEQQGLGCSICKGPPEKPGIFIQSTKAGKLAREVGLHSGDQIVHCNGIDFLNIPFGDAVFHLKASKQLNLTIWKGAGSSLFPNESSGYESSSGSSSGNSKPRGKRTIKTSFPVPPRAPPPPQSSSSPSSSNSSAGTSSPSTNSRGVASHRNISSPRLVASPKSLSSPRSDASHRLLSSPRSDASHRIMSSPRSESSHRVMSSPRSEASHRVIASPMSESSHRVVSSPMSESSHRMMSSPHVMTSPRHGGGGGIRTSSQLSTSQASPASLRYHQGSIIEKDLERERQKLESEKEKLRREQQALEIERKRLEEEKILFRSTIQRTQSEERPTKTVQSAVREIERSSSVHSTARETLLIESIVNRRRNSMVKSTELDSDTNLSEYSQNSSRESVTGKMLGDDIDDGGGGGSGAGSLASALQSEIKRRAEKNSGMTVTTKGILKKSDSNSLKKKSGSLSVEHTNKHDLLIAEFKQAHMKKLQQDGGKTPTPSSGINGSSDESSDFQDSESGQSKLKAPPPPPPMKTSSLMMSSQTSSLSSDSSEANRSLSTFRPDSSSSRLKSDSEESETTEKQSEGSVGVGGGGTPPIFIPGIPTPDYDATPDRSPSATGKLYIRNRNIGKRVSPPTIEGITRAKSLSSLVTSSEDHKSDSDGRSKGKANSPGGLLSSGSMKDISKTPDSSPLQSINSSLRSYEAPSLNFSYSSQSSFNITGKEYCEGGSLVSGNASQFSKRHRDLEGVSMESFQIVSMSGSSSGEKDSFQFQTKPCHPSQIPKKEEGEEAKLASQDYRAVNAQPRPRPYCLDIKSLQREFQEDKQPNSNKLKGARYPGVYKEDKNRGFPKFSGLKKPAPPPPILRKI